MDRELLFRLIRTTTSLRKAKAWLEKRGLPTTAASWDDFIDKRLRPNLNSNTLSASALADLLAESEEYGHQHIFLYRLRAASQLPSIRGFRNVLRRNDALPLLNEPLILDRPEKFTLTDAKIGDNSGDTFFFLKFTGQHRYLERIGETPAEAVGPGERIFSVQYREVIDRAIWVAHLHSSGLLELRIQSKKNSSKYRDEVQGFWLMIEPYFPRKSFESIDLSPAKMRILADRSRLEKEVRYTNSTLLNNKDSKIEASAGTLYLDLHKDDGADKSIEAFLAYNQAYCDGLNIWFLESSSTALTSDTHVILAGEPNEYALPASCLRQEHDHVRNRIIKLNK